MVANKDLKRLAREGSVPLWLIAKRLGISDQKLYRDWREELPEDQKITIRSIINELKDPRTF